MHSISSSFGSQLAGGAIPRLPKSGAAQSGGPAAPGAWLRFKAWLAESGLYGGAGCRKALLERNSYLLSSAARQTEALTGKTKYMGLFERQVKLVGGFDRNAQPAEARAVRAMTRLIGLARLAGTDSYEAHALLVIREARSEQAAADLFRTSKFHKMLKDKGVNADLVNRFEDDLCRRCASCARANPSEDVEAIIKSQLGDFLPSDDGMGKLIRLSQSKPSSAASVLHNYLVEMRNRMWTINERDSTEPPGFSPDHQLHRHMLRSVLKSAVREVSAQSGDKASARHIRDAEELCMSKIDLVPDYRLTEMKLDQFISKNFYDLLPFSWEDDSTDEDHASEDTPVSSRSEVISGEDRASEDAQVSSRSEVISEAGAPELVELDWQRDPNTGNPVGLLRNGERVRRFSFPDAGGDNTDSGDANN